jgi:hypothetical protein
MGSEWVSRIRHLELKDHFLLVTQHHLGPRQLEFIIDNLPNLQTSKLTNDFDKRAKTHVATSATDRTSQERRALLQMAAS